MTDPRANEAAKAPTLGPVHASDDIVGHEDWTFRLVVFLRAMAGVSLIKGLYHWAIVCGVGAPTSAGFEADPTGFQVATVFFAVIDLVAAVGLWLAAPWGAVVWLTSVISMVAVESLFSHVYGGSFLIIIVELVLLGTYLWLALMSARQAPP